MRKKPHEDHEIIEVMPIILGGSAKDKSNKAKVSRKQHIEYVKYWNKVVKEQKKTAKNPTTGSS